MVHDAPDPDSIRPLIDAALAEDIGLGDATTNATVPRGARVRAEVRAKESGVVCGIPVMKAVFGRVEPDLVFGAEASDGDRVTPGQVVARLEGPARGVLTGERVALNFLQHLSGIATATAHSVAVLEGTGTALLDTRKTIPGLRLLAKYAVRCGGGTNHRRGLDDMVLIKENHILAAGGITAAVGRARERYPDLAVEVEVTDREELREALESRPDRIMLDNFQPAEVATAVASVTSWAAERKEPRPEIELSGGITGENLAAYGAAGADYISSGAVTHSVRALDFSLEVTERL